MFIRSRLWVTASMVIATCCMGFASVAVHAQAIENPAIGKPLQEAQKLAAKKQWAAALAELKKAEAVPDKTPYAQYKLNEFKAYLLTEQKKYGEAAAVIESMIKSGQTPQDQLDKQIKTAAQMFFTVKQYGKAIEYAQRGLKSRPGDQELLETLGQAQFLTQDYKGAAATMQQLVATTERAGRKPQENWLQIIYNAHHQLNNRDGIAQVVQQLLRHYPKPEYWDTLLDIKTNKNYPERVELGYHRLMFNLGILKDPSDYEEMALNAIDSGAPGEAVRVLQTGLEKKMFTGANEARFQRMLELAKKEAAAKQAALPQLAKEAQAAKTGQASVALGQAYLGFGQYDEAIGALQRGIKQGSLEDIDEARISLGLAYLQKNQLEQARGAFSAVDRKSQWHELAQLWLMRAQTSQPTPPAQATAAKPQKAS